MELSTTICGKEERSDFPASERGSDLELESGSLVPVKDRLFMWLDGGPCVQDGRE